MLTLDPVFKEALSKIPSTLCWCWLITHVDGGMLGFTSLDVPIANRKESLSPFFLNLGNCLGLVLLKASL